MFEHTIGCFARITDITPKSIEELRQLHSCGYNGITIGVETGDDEALTFMHKGYTSADILEQCRKLDEAGIEYNFFYLTGIYGKNKSTQGVENTVKVFNQLTLKSSAHLCLPFTPLRNYIPRYKTEIWLKKAKRKNTKS